jgi:hypothetical protein
MGTYSARASTLGAPTHGLNVREGGAERGEGSSARLPWGLLAAVLGVVVWLIVDPRTPDLAGQVYRANLFGEVGWAVWDGRWYGGHDLPGYSLVFPPLAALMGVRAVGALAVLTSATLFEQVARKAYGSAARWGSVWFAVAALGDVWSGRVTFALGVGLALAAVLMLAQPVRGAGLMAGALAAVCAACSPVAGVLLGLAGVTHSLATRSWRSAIVLGAPSAVVVLGLAGLFPEGGWEPYPLLSFLATVAAVGGFLWVLPGEQRLLRVGAWVYLAACVGCVAVHTPMGANVERYGVLLAGPLLLCATFGRIRGDDGRGAPGRGRVGGGEGWAAPGRGRVGGGEGWATLVWGRVGGGKRLATPAVLTWVLLGIGLWTVWGPARETLAVAGNASTSPSYYIPVERFVAAHGGTLVRVEVPFTRGHWEAAWLARTVALARGWEKQLDERYNGILLSRGLTPVRYRRWLREQAVDYVALPDTPLDPSSAREGDLIRAGLPYLRQVLRTAHWRIYAVLDPTPLAQGPGFMEGMGHDWFALRARARGSFVVRVRYTRYWTVARGAACVGRAPGGWTAVAVRGPGTVRVVARFSLGRALDLNGAAQCAGARSYRPV